jgi:hypothetical protein
MKKTKKTMKKKAPKRKPAPKKKAAPKKKSAPKRGGRRVEVNDDIRSLTRVSGGTSFAITLPHAVVRAFKWKGRQKLKLIVDEKRQSITIRDWKK